MELSQASPESGTSVEHYPGVLTYVRALTRWEQIAVGSSAFLLAVGCFIRFGFTGRAIVAAVFAAALALLTAIDIDRRLLPNAIVLPTLAFALVAQIALFPGRTLEWLLAAFLAALFFYVPMLVYPAGMGMGDVKLAALLGAVLGKSMLAAIGAGLVAAAAGSLFVLARGGLAARKKTIPFGPFLALGGLVVLFLGGR